MTRDTVDKNQRNGDHDAEETAPETERKGSASQNRSYPAVVVNSMLSRGLGDPHAYADVARKFRYESERHVNDDLDSADFNGQRSFIGGKDVPRGTPGSTRPDNYSETLRLSVDVKNYGIETIKGQTRLVKNVVRQMTQRGTHLPKGSRQGVVIDARGQVVTPNQIAALRARIVRASGGLVAPDDIVFLTE